MTLDNTLFFVFLQDLISNKVTQIIWLHIIQYERRYPPDRQEVKYEGTTKNRELKLFLPYTVG